MVGGGGGTWLEVETPVPIPHWYMYTHYSQPLLTTHIRSAPTYPGVCGGGGGGTGLANDAQTVQCTCHVWSTVKMFDFFTCVHDAYIHVWREPAQARKKSKKSQSTHTSTRAQQNVSMFGCWRQKTRQKIAVRSDKMEHFTHTFESLSPEIYTGMRIAKCG